MRGEKTSGISQDHAFGICTDSIRTESFFKKDFFTTAAQHRIITPNTDKLKCDFIEFNGYEFELVLNIV